VYSSGDEQAAIEDTLTLKSKRERDLTSVIK